MSTTTAPARSPRLQTVIYADFTSPASYLASVRQDRLLARGGLAPQWCAVEHRPSVPASGIRLDGRGRAARERELHSLRLLGLHGEIFDARVPGFIPSTHAAAAAYAEACLAGRGDRMRQRLFEAYWVHGVDIGHPDVLAHLAQADHTAAPGDLRDKSTQSIDDSTESLTTDAHALRCVAQWQDAWVRLGAPVDFTVVTPYTVLWGVAAVRSLEVDPVLAA